MNAASNTSSSILRRPALWIFAAVLVFAGGNIWLYRQGTRTLQAQFDSQSRTILNGGGAEEALDRLFQHTENWGRNMTLATVAGGVGLVFFGALGLMMWRQITLGKAQSVAELNVKLTQANDLIKRSKVKEYRLERQLRSAYEEMEQRVEERTQELSRTCASLEQELNSRRRAEKALSSQAKELERSKDVLELHVQARTQELQRLKRTYELILNSAGEGIYGLDLNGRTTFVNPTAAALAGWEIEELIGKTEQEIFCFNNEALEGQTSSLKLDSHGQHLSEQEFRRKDGNFFTVEYIRTPIIENERLTGAVVIFKDITERKQTEEALAHKAAALARSNAELEQFAYVASHDMQEPLRKIQAVGDRLKSKCAAVDLQEGRDYLERMLRAAGRMQTLINDLLTFSRVISTTQPFVPVNLEQTAREVLGDLEYRIEQTQATVELSELPTIEADPTQMRQLLQNLISNALKFNKPNQPPVVHIHAEVMKGILTLGAEGEEEQEICRLVVQDNGIGFEECFRDKIFAVFQRLHGRSEYEGTGVGLAVCRRITDRHGGSIDAYSQTGQGATFVVNLPVRHNQSPTS